MGRILCLAALLAALLAPAAQAGGPAATVRMLDRQMNKAGSASGAYVVDLDTGQALYARAPDVPRMPASVNKLYTTSAALERYGAEGQLEHRGAGRQPTSTTSAWSTATCTCAAAATRASAAPRRAAWRACWPAAA